jgi:hypothetical protein
MKNTINDLEATSPSTNPNVASLQPGAHTRSDHRGDHCALRRGLGFWDLTFAGQHAILKHEQGLAYVAYLLLNPPKEPIHGLALALKIRALRDGRPADSYDIRQERALALDDAEAARSLFHKQQELEKILDDEDQTDPVKQEVLRDLVAIYEFQKKNISRTTSVAQRASDAVGKAIKRFQQRLAKAVDPSGNPHPVLRPFADHIKKHILVPSGRGSGHGGTRPPQGCGGFFTCQPERGVTWTSQ